MNVDQRLCRLNNAFFLMMCSCIVTGAMVTNAPVPESLEGPLAVISGFSIGFVVTWSALANLDS